ncbi:hypothetical protein ACFLVG_05910 [Chloroflexota bacterium]
MLKSVIKRGGVVLIGVLIVALGRGLFFYNGFYSAPPSDTPGFEYVVVPPAPITEFSDIHEEGEGIILIDSAHDNAFNKEELNVLLLRLVSRGSTIKFLSEEDDLKTELLGEEEEEELEEELEEEPLDGEVVEEGTLSEEQEVPEKPLAEEEEEEKLPPADAFIVVCPQLEFSKDEVETVDEFLDNGGKLLLVADPTRYDSINSLSINFGLIFESDYLYNMKENENNYRNIFIAEFKENKLTEGLKKIVFYTAGSISSANSSIAFVGENTFSNVVETRSKLSPIVLAQDSKVLAIYDLTFMTEPQNGILDNNRLISNVADWLMSLAEEAKSK